VVFHHLFLPLWVVFHRLRGWRFTVENFFNPQAFLLRLDDLVLGQLPAGSMALI